MHSTRGKHICTRFHSFIIYYWLYILCFSIIIVHAIDLIHAFLSAGRFLLNAINILPEAMQSLILFSACLVLAFVTIRYFSLWWGLVFCAVVYVYYRLLGPYRVIRMGVVGMEMVMRWMSYIFHYPTLSAVIIVLLLLGALCWPLWSWYSAYKKAKRQDHMYSLIYSTHEAVLTIQQRQDELIKAVHELQKKPTNT